MEVVYEVGGSWFDCVDGCRREGRRRHGGGWYSEQDFEYDVTRHEEAVDWDFRDPASGCESEATHLRSVLDDAS